MRVVENLVENLSQINPMEVIARSRVKTDHKSKLIFGTLQKLDDEFVRTFKVKLATPYLGKIISFCNISSMSQILKQKLFTIVK